MGFLCWSVVVKKELSRKNKLTIYRSIYVPTLTYGHELWVMTERIKSCTQAKWVSSAGWLGAPLEIGWGARSRSAAPPHWEEPAEVTLKKTQDTLECLCCLAGLGMPWDPPGRAGGSVWGEGCLHVPAYCILRKRRTYMLLCSRQHVNAYVQRNFSTEWIRREATERSHEGSWPLVWVWALCGGL